MDDGGNGHVGSERTQAYLAAERGARLEVMRNVQPWVRELEDDIVGEVMVRFAGQDWPSIDNPGGWGRVTAYRHIVDLARERNREPNRKANQAFAERLENPDHHRHRDAGVEAVEDFLRDSQLLSTSDQAVAKAIVAQILELLSPREMEIVERVAGGQTYAEIADAMDFANANSVKSTVNAMRRRVETQIGGRENLHEWRGHERPY
jgi:DNA-directed RNA polymerase specialized sigma24 family protein